MNYQVFALRALGVWMAIKEVASAHEKPILIACAFVAPFLFLPFYSVWIALPALVSILVIGWATFWPLGCSTWLGWIWMLFRLVIALAVSNIAWTVSAVFQ